MLFNGQNRRTVFILGSGATRGAIPHIVFHRKRIKPPLNSDFFKVARVYARACGATSIEAKRVERLERVFREYLSIKKDSLTMESAFSLLFMAKDFPEIYSASRGRKRTPGDMQEIEDFLFLTFDILTLLDRRHNKDTEYDRLAAALRPNDSVITLNYDTLLDSALVRRGWDPMKGYKISGGKRKFKWSPSISNRNLDDVKLLKLHGSLNWFVKGSFSNISTVLRKKPSRIDKPRVNLIKGYLRQIVPPIYGKYFEHNHWQTLWSEAYTALREAEVLVVIGCSLIDTDFHLRALIGRAAYWRKKEQNLFHRVFLVDRTKVRRKWASVLKGAFKKSEQYRYFSYFTKKEIQS